LLAWAWCIWGMWEMIRLVMLAADVHSSLCEFPRWYKD